MKSFVSVLAAACLVTVRAHTMLVCSATSCNTPGRVTVFLGTYDHGGDFGANANPTPGEIQITTMGGTTYKFEFSKQCQSPTLMGSSGFAAVEASLKAASGQGGLTNVCRDQRVTNKPIIDDDSIITCYNHDIKGLASTAREGRSVTVGSKKIYTVSEWETAGRVFCGFPNRSLKGYYYMVMDNVQPGDYTMKGWTTDFTLASGRESDASIAQYGLGVCGIIGYDGNPTSALAKSKEYAFSLSVATTTCAASNKCGVVGTSIEGLLPASVSDCGNKDPGYMCDARCDQGYTQVGSMMCLADGSWGGFQCVQESAASRTKPCDLNDVSQAITGAVGVEFNGAAMCGYTSAHGAKCTAVCAAPRVLVETSSNSLECVNGNWVANGAECKEIVDVVLAPPPSITVAEADKVSLKITFGTATECSTGKYCSAATKYRFRLTITDVAAGQVETSDCPDFNSGVAPTDGLICYLPTGETLGNKKYGITASVENRAGWSGPSQTQELNLARPPCEYTDNAGGDACASTSSKCNDVGAEGDAIRKMCGYTCRSSEYMGKTTAGPNAGQRTCITSSAPTNQPTSKPTKSPTVPPTQAPSRRPHVASGRSNDHSGEYHEDNFDCYYKNCQEWDCAMWCKCFEQETEDADLYADSGCEDDGDNSCECVENVLGLHETEDNWDFTGEASAKPDQTKPHYKNIVVGKGEANFAETVKTFKRPFILDVWMKQDLDQEAAGYQTVPAPGNVFVFPQNTDSGCSGYCMGINQLGSAAYNFVDPMANDYFYFAGRDSEYQQRKNKLNGNQTSVNEHELWQKLTIKFSLQGTVAYYFNAEKNPRFETHDTTYMDGKIRLGKNVANYRYHSPQLTKGARDASVNIAPWRRLGSEYEEYWGEQYRTQWD